jgi:hypothetical protein
LEPVLSQKFHPKDERAASNGASRWSVAAQATGQKLLKEQKAAHQFNIGL